MNFLTKLGAGLGATLATGSVFAQAAAVDVTDATGALAEVGIAVGLIGLAMVAAISAGIAYRWIVAFLAK